jgi:hypothetical protein
MNRLPFVAGRLEVEQQIGASVLQMLEEEPAAGVVEMCFRPRVPFLNDATFAGLSSLTMQRLPYCGLALGSFSAGAGWKAALMRDTRRGRPLNHFTV